MAHLLRTASVALAVILAFTALSCGIKGPPQAPLLKIIPPVADLTAGLAGSTVRLSWTPSFNYSDGSELQLRGVSIYRLDEDLTTRLLPYTAAAAGGQEGEQPGGNPPQHSLTLLAQRIRALPVADFRRKAELVARLRVEQLLDRAEGGKIRWEEPLPLDAVALPSSRCVYAVIEEDTRGRLSRFSNFAQVIPMNAPPGPTAPGETLTQNSLTLTWDYPVRDEAALQQLTLVGFNIYKTAADVAGASVPVNATPLPTTAPVDWQARYLISHQQVTGSISRYAYLFVTSNAPRPAGIEQTLIAAEKIADYRGSTVEVQLILSSPGGESKGQIVLDASRDPLKTDEPAAGSEVFGEEENPLISRTDFQIGNEPRSLSTSFRLPSDARALVLRIEPRRSEAISAPFIVENVRAHRQGMSEELVKNGDFSGFNPTRYIEKIEKFGGVFHYRISAVYNVSGFVVESEPTEPLVVEVRDTFPPDAPRNPRVLAAGDSVTVTWNAPRAGDLRGYLVFRREGAEGQWQRLTQQPIKGTIFHDSDVTTGTEYSYRILAVDKEGNRSEYSDVVSATINPN